MSSGLRLRRPVFLPPDSAVLSVFAASLFAPSFFPSSVFLLPARISLCPFLPLSVFLSARISPALSGRPPSSVFRLVFLLSFLVFPFIVHRPPLVVRRPLSIPCCPLSIPCCPLSIPCRLLSVAHCPSLAARCSSPVASPVPRRLYLYPVPRRASFRCRSVRITAFVSAESRPACLRELLAVSFRSGFRRSVFPQKCVRPPYLGRRAVSDKITPCVLLSGAIFPARPAILLTIWQRLPFGTTFVQIQGVTGAPDPQGGRIPAARKENGKNINN